MGNFNFRFILKTIGFLLIIESVFLLVAALIAFYYNEKCLNSVLICSGITALTGILLRVSGREYTEKPIGKRESFLVVTLTWVMLSLFGMLPFYLSGAIPSITDAYFETMSGFTTTGASILTDVDAMPHALLFWRSLTQWIGGIGIVVFALAVLPMVGGNASVLYDAETTGIASDRFQPRVTQVAKRLWIIYISLTLLLVVLLNLGAMNLFDSVCHALTTISTGGYSTKQMGLAYWDSAYLDYTLGVFMFIGGINFSLLYFSFKGTPSKLFKDEEFRWYTCIFLSFVVFITIGLYFLDSTPNDLELSFRVAFFQVSSVITTTGFIVPDYMNWGSFYLFCFCFLMLFCACAGSTSGGMKMVRLVVLSKNAINEFKLQVHPNAVLPVRLNGGVVSIDIVTKILAFIFLYLTILVVSFLVLSLTGMGFEESIGAALTCMSNVGPGLGKSGVNGHFAEIPVFSKWYLCVLMLTGRLELFTVLSLFMPAFWKK